MTDGAVLFTRRILAANALRFCASGAIRARFERAPNSSRSRRDG
jgi:hypothetical protein